MSPDQRAIEVPPETNNPILNIQKILAKYDGPHNKVPKPILLKPPPKYILTWHLRTRYVQRFQSPFKYAHLDQCEAGFCRICPPLIEELNREANSQYRDLTAEITARLEQATEERSYINNTDFMGYLYEQYGYDTRFKFLRDKDVVFILRISGSSMIAVTVLSMDHQIGQYITSHVKYKKERQHG